jgi:hypothetical protein
MTIPHGFTARRSRPNVCLAFLFNLTNRRRATDERISDQSLGKPSPRLTVISIRLIPYKVLDCGFVEGYGLVNSGGDRLYVTE